MSEAFVPLDYKVSLSHGEPPSLRLESWLVFFFFKLQGTPDRKHDLE